MDKDAMTGGWHFLGGMAIVVGVLLALLAVGWVAHHLPGWAADPFGW